MNTPHAPPPWAARVSLRFVSAIDVIRRLPGLEGCLSGEWLWVKGGTLSDVQRSLLNCVPWLGRYDVRDGGWLFEKGHELPSIRLPAGPWRPLPEVLVPLVPTPAMPGELRGRVLFEMQRSEVEQPAALIGVPAELWQSYAVAAPDMRLKRLRFVLNKPKRLALIRGTPLPPLPGLRYHVQENIAIPVGFEPFPRLGPRTMAALLGLADGEMALLDEHGSYARIREELWRPASRSAVRMNADAVS